MNASGLSQHLGPTRNMGGNGANITFGPMASSTYALTYPFRLRKL